MYTVLFVDDEEDVIQIMMEKIPWSELGFSVIGSAPHGVKALELMEEFSPDVVMTDIRMPYMDGMELARRVREEFPATRTLLFTGFDEFEYAKKAICLDVEDYILKPLNCREMTGVFMRLRQKMDAERQEKRNAQTLQKYYAESLPILKANFCTSLIEGRLSQEEIKRGQEEYQITFSKPFVCVLVVHISGTQTSEGMTAPLLAASVEKQAQEYLREKWSVKGFSYMGNHVMLAELNTEEEAAVLTDDCDRFCRYIHRMVGAVVTVGIGKTCGSLSELADSYNGAREAVSYRVIYGATKAINIREIAPQEDYSSGEEPGVKLSGLLKKIRLGTEKEVSDAVDRYSEQLVLRSKSLLAHHVDIMDMLSDFYRFAVNNEITGHSFQDIGRLYNQLMDMDPVSLRQWILEKSLSFRKKLILERNSSTRSFVQRAKEHVQNSYADESISLDRVCHALGVSNAYFSTVFKKETGQSFITYLTNYRMEQAARLLIETNEKSYIVARRVGYSDSNYFSYVFKRRFGVSPSKYRTEHTEG